MAKKLSKSGIFSLLVRLEKQVQGKPITMSDLDAGFGWPESLHASFRQLLSSSLLVLPSKGPEHPRIHCCRKFRRVLHEVVFSVVLNSGTSLSAKCVLSSATSNRKAVTDSSNFTAASGGRATKPLKSMSKPSNKAFSFNAKCIFRCMSRPGPMCASQIFNKGK